MNDVDLICIWIAELVPLVATTFSLIYGLKHFFQKRKAAFFAKYYNGDGKSCAWQRLSLVSDTYK